MPDTDPTPGPPNVTGRVAAIVLAIAAQPRLSVAELAEVVRLPRSTTHRLVSELVTGSVVKRAARGQYELRVDGPQRQQYYRLTLRANVAAMVADLAEVTGSRVRFGVWHARGMSALSYRSGRDPAAGSLVNELLPIHATALGKALLAFAPDRVVRRVLSRPLPRHTSRTLTTPDALKKALAATRSRGIAVARHEFDVDEWALAVPVFGRNGVIASLEVSETGSLSEVRTLAPTLRYAARALGRSLAEHPQLLPTGNGRTPLRWPVDVTSVGDDDDVAQEVTPLAAVGRDNRTRRDSAYSTRWSAPSVREIHRLGPTAG